MTDTLQIRDAINVDGVLKGITGIVAISTFPAAVQRKIQSAVDVMIVEHEETNDEQQAICSMLYIMELSDKFNRNTISEDKMDSELRKFIHNKGVKRSRLTRYFNGKTIASVVGASASVMGYQLYSLYTALNSLAVVVLSSSSTLAKLATTSAFETERNELIDKITTSRGAGLYIKYNTVMEDFKSNGYMAIKTLWANLFTAVDPSKRYKLFESVSKLSLNEVVRDSIGVPSVISPVETRSMFGSLANMGMKAIESVTSGIIETSEKLWGGETRQNVNRICTEIKNTDLVVDNMYQIFYGLVVFVFILISIVVVVKTVSAAYTRSSKRKLISRLQQQRDSLPRLEFSFHNSSKTNKSKRTKSKVSKRSKSKLSKSKKVRN